MSAAVILVAGGQGARLGATGPKAFAYLEGEPLLWHALSRVLAVAEVGHVVVVAPATHLEPARQIVASVRQDGHASVDVVPGGAERSDSVAAGLQALAPGDQVVLVHDAARCLAPPSLFERLLGEVRGGHPAVVPGLPLTDTVKEVDADGLVTATPDRSRLRAVQTPQAFTREVLEAAHAAADTATDDAGLVERVGVPVRVVEGDPRALKITTAHDLAVAELVLGEE